MPHLNCLVVVASDFARSSLIRTYMNNEFYSNEAPMPLTPFTCLSSINYNFSLIPDDYSMSVQRYSVNFSNLPRTSAVSKKIADQPVDELENENGFCIPSSSMPFSQSISEPDSAVSCGFKIYNYDVSKSDEEQFVGEHELDSVDLVLYCVGNLGAITEQFPSCSR